MAPLVLEGETLGKRQHHYNKIVKDAIDSNVSLDNLKDQDNASDLDAMFKVDIASHYRDVDHILDAFKSEDMLQVSRALKQGKWLITDNQYKQFININYLKDKLFPHMTSKAKCKLLLAIRIHLKDEARVDEFFKHYEDEDSKAALRWLPNCSVKVIEEAVQKHLSDISDHLLKRLCEKTINVLEVLLKTQTNHYRRNCFKDLMFLMNTEPEKFVIIAEQLPKYNAPSYNAKHTKLLMKHCKNRVLDKFDYYSRLVHLPTFGKCLGKDHIANFILTLASKENPQDWFNYEYLKPLIDIMPAEGKFDFIKSVFIDKEKIGRKPKPPLSMFESDIVLCSAPVSGRMQCMKVQKRKMKYNKPSTSQKSVYKLYRHAPFHVAFPELKKMIRIESSADERSAMLAVLAGCARGAPGPVTMLLQYYHDNHINEPFKNKVHFINNITSKTTVHKYDENQWKLLQVLFQSMDVYAESEANVQKCLEAEVVYRTVRGEPIPEIVVKKFCWNTMKHFYKQLNHEEKEKVFMFLYNLKENNVSLLQTVNDEAIPLLDDLMMLIFDWNKDIADYPLVIKKIKELVQSKKSCVGYYSSDLLNNKKKSWRRHFFEESLIVNPSETSVINALKHDPELLIRYQDKVDSIRSNDRILPKRLLQKLRIYWPALACEWTAAYRQQLRRSAGHRAATRALCTLLPPNELLPFIETYVPENSKIDWQASDASQINMQKLIAKSLHLARPQPSPDVVMLFLKGDYVQFALPSLSSIFYNLSYFKAQDHIGKLLDAPVSVQKHGIRFAVVRMNQQELENTLERVWKNTKNSSIRAVIFQIAFKQLCNKNADKSLQIWELLSKFIDSLSEKENKIIYTLLMEVTKIPKELQGKFCEKSYKFLKTLPVKAGFTDSLFVLVSHVATIMDSVNPQFARELIMEHIDNCFRRDMQRLNDERHMRDVIVAYLMCVDDEETQMHRYKDIFLPIIELVFALWDVELKDTQIYKRYFENLLTGLHASLQHYVAKPTSVIPTKMFSAIHEALESQPDRFHYVTLESWALAIKFLECAEKVRPTLKKVNAEDEKLLEKSQNKKWDLLCYKIIPAFSVVCIDRLKKALASSFPSMNIIFAKALRLLLLQMARTWEFADFELIFYKSILEQSDDVTVYVAILFLLPEDLYQPDTIEKLEKLKQLIYDHPSKEVKMHYFSKYNDIPKVSAPKEQ